MRHRRDDFAATNMRQLGKKQIRNAARDIGKRIAIKEEKPDLDEKDMDCSLVKEEVDHEIVFDGETKAEPIEEENEDSVLPKDDSKLDLWRVKQENPQFAFKGSPGVYIFILFWFLFFIFG